MNKVNINNKNQKIINILRIIHKSKAILFGQLNNFQNNLRATRWQKIYDEAVRLNIVAPNKGWKYLRDILWQRWKSKTLVKVEIVDPENPKVNILSPLSERDEIVLDILGLKAEQLSDGPVIKVEVNSEPEDQDFEVISDEDITLQSAAITSNLCKLPNITFIPVQKHVDINDEKESKDLNMKRRLSINDISSSCKADEALLNNVNRELPEAKKLKTTNSLNTDISESILQFPADIKNIHKMILENVRDIKMKLLIQKKSQHCESCCSTNKEMLLLKTKMLEVQEKNLEVQNQILEELRKHNLKTRTEQQKMENTIVPDTIIKTNNEESSSVKKENVTIKKENNLT